jgi:hypothetical protein
MSDTGEDVTSRPEWWDANQKIREQYSLPEYNAPRFEDGTYTHEVVPELQETHGIEIRFIGLDTIYPEDWQIRIDGDRVSDIARRRDKQGNTIYEMTAARFRDIIEEAVEERQDDD